ncbi:hypothetical protein H5410_002579 [Solanum commersonii]|uniref:Uncharacterized protein n=1 Tax=Solanum commersonii TaxID=4109 RepID=A0A9J6B2B5_SOLCO|nr:hypothetical protein H5410_002579 [Solanum commersonii]
MREHSRKETTSGYRHPVYLSTSGIGKKRRGRYKCVNGISQEVPREPPQCDEGVGCNQTPKQLQHCKRHMQCLQ